MNDTIYDNFSSSDKKRENFLTKIFQSPLFCIFAGPFSLMLVGANLLLFNSFCLAFIFFISSLGYLFVWKYKVKGAFYSLGLVIFSLGFLFFIHEMTLSVYSLLSLTLTLISSYFVIAVTSEHLSDHEAEEKKQNEELFVKAEKTYQTNLKYLESQLDRASSDYIQLQKQEKHLEKEIAGYKQLLMASHLQADGYFEKVKNLELLLQGYQDKLLELEQAEQEYYNIKKRCSYLQKQLNYFRLDCYQKEIFLTAQHEERVSCKEVLLSEKELRLMQDRYIEIQSKYDYKLLEYQRLCLDITSKEVPLALKEESFEQIEENVASLSELRVDLSKIEESIEHITAQNEGQSLTTLSASQREVGRLERENQILLNSLYQLLNPLVKEEKNNPV